MNKKVIIIGNGGHGNVIKEIIIASKDQVVGFLDDDDSKDNLGKINDYKKYNDCYFILGIGDLDIREKIVNSMPNVKWYTAISPFAIISNSAKIEEGSVIMANAIINTKAYIGKHVIINTGAIVEHNNIINDYSHISVGVKMGGSITIGKKTLVGIGSIICNNLKICDNCIIGAGSVVVKNIILQGTYAGMPAKKIK